MNEKDLFNELLKNRPEAEENPVTIGEGRGRKFLVPKWMTGLPEDKYVQSVTRFFKSSGIDIPVQIWYDLVVLRLDSIEDRPRCKAPGCNNPVEYEGSLYKGRGYFDTCCRACAGVLNRSQYVNTEEMNQKRSATLLGRKKSDTHRANIARCKTGTKASLETRRKQSLRKIAYLMRINEDSSITTYDGGRYHKGIIELKKCSTRFHYMSSWELGLLTELDSDPDVIEIRPVQGAIPYLHDDGSTHHYLPDIYIKLSSGKDYVLEVKPRSMILSDRITRLKLRAGINFYSDSNRPDYVIVTERKLRLVFSSGSILSIL